MSRWATGVWLILACGMLGCGEPAPPPDPANFHQQMRELNEEALRQEGRLPRNAR